MTFSGLGPILRRPVVYTAPQCGFHETLVLALLLSSTLFAQSQAAISVAGNVPRPLTLRTEDLAKMPRARIAAYDESGFTKF